MTSIQTSLSNRLRANLGLKLFLLLTLPIITTTAYFTIQRIILFPVRTMPVTWLDRATPFEPGWVWAYLSLYLLNPIAPLLTRRRDDLLHYVRGVTFYFTTGFVCFVVFPVAAPRPVAAGGDWLYDHLILVDRVYNSMPSLHATCAVFAVLYAAYASRDSSRPRLRMILLTIAWVWVGLILYSTIATRQHFAIDLLLGMLLGWLAYICFVKRGGTHPMSFVPALVEAGAA